MSIGNAAMSVGGVVHVGGQPDTQADQHNTATVLIRGKELLTYL